MGSSSWRNFAGRGRATFGRRRQVTGIPIFTYDEWEWGAQRCRSRLFAHNLTEEKTASHVVDYAVKGAASPPGRVRIEVHDVTGLN